MVTFKKTIKRQLELLTKTINHISDNLDEFVRRNHVMGTKKLPKLYFSFVFSLLIRVQTSTKCMNSLANPQRTRVKVDYRLAVCRANNRVHRLSKQNKVQNTTLLNSL